MDKILFIAPAESGQPLSRHAREALSAAKSLADALGADLAVGLFGDDVRAAADSVAGCGAATILGIQDAALAAPRYATDVAAAETLAKTAGATVIMAPADTRVSRFAAGLAQRIGAACDTQLTGLEAKDGKVVATRWYYRQRMVAELTREARPWVLTVMPGCFEPCEGAAGSVQVEAAAFDAPATRTKVTGVEAPPADEQTIRPGADLLLVAGAGWMKKQGDGTTHVDEAGKLILDFLDKTKASLGSSKSLVDFEGDAVLPFLTHMHQIGQTGATPRHPKGLATCCHGEEPHVVGWRFITERRAVNLDAGCGWAHGKADVLYVADAFAVMKKVNELLGS